MEGGGSGGGRSVGGGELREEVVDSLWTQKLASGCGQGEGI